MTTHHPTPSSYSIEICRGGRDGSCRFALPAPNSLPGRLAAAVEAAGWPAFLHERLNGASPRHHQQFRVAVAACANGCSRPQIADVGLVLTCRPSLHEALCSRCGDCAEACPDGLLHMRAAGPALNHSLRCECLGCGRCVAACPAGALGALDRTASTGAQGASPAPLGFRVFVGGRLGRRPRLAEALPGLHTGDAVCALMQRVLMLHMTRFRHGARPGDSVSAADFTDLATSIGQGNPAPQSAQGRQPEPARPALQTTCPDERAPDDTAASARPPSSLSCPDIKRARS